MTHEAQRGELIRLAVDADGGDGLSVRFEVATSAGEVVAAFDAPIEGGVARTSWAIEVGDRPLPVTLSFTARVADDVVKAGDLTVQPPGRFGAIALRTLAASGASPGKLGQLVAGLPASAEAADRGDPGGGPAEHLAVCIDVAGPDGAALVGPFALRLVLESESAMGRGDFAPIDDVVREIDVGGAHAVHAMTRRPSTGSPAHTPRVRVRAGWHRRPGEATAGTQPLVLTSEPV